MRNPKCTFHSACTMCMHFISIVAISVQTSGMIKFINVSACLFIFYERECCRHTLSTMFYYVNDTGKSVEIKGLKTKRG